MFILDIRTTEQMVTGGQLLQTSQLHRSAPDLLHLADLAESFIEARGGLRNAQTSRRNSDPDSWLLFTVLEF